ncbi:MAG: iron hydrogenase small subunit [Alkalispirochaeta sp.]
MEDLDRLIQLGEEIRDTALCGLGQTAPNPVLSILRHAKRCLRCDYGKSTVREGMAVHTNSRRVRQGRRSVVELLLSEHTGNCRVGDRGDDRELKALAHELGMRELPFEGERPLGRGYQTTIGPAFGGDLSEVPCVQCDQCAAVCPMGAPLGLSSGAADIFANTGGVKEAEVTFTDTVEEWRFFEGVTTRVAVAHGLGNTAKLLDRINRGEGEYHFVEIMSCPGGCIGGGGQPRTTDDHVRQARIAAIHREDEDKELRTSHENPAIQEIYARFLGAPLGERSHHLLHTSYAPKTVSG